MPLAPGTHVGSFEIFALIGAGGMGEVYRARDQELKRDVALKVLSPAFASDASRMARFQREAEVLASLNHLNIAAIYEVEEGALVMELVEGSSPRGPMPFEDAWRIAAQIVAALEFAHEKGIVHRDLKPDNIKVTSEGVVKLLDFGLAKALSQPSSLPPDDPMNSPTFMSGGTQAGVILGTAAYMSPEQARGKPADKRVDIWAFGVVLYELLSGRRPFQGQDVSDILASVIKDEPEWDAVGPEAQKLLRKCLAKDPRERLRDIGDVAALLESAGQRVSQPAAPTSKAKLPWAVAGIAVLATLVLGYVALSSLGEETRRVEKASLLYTEGSVPTNYAVPALSPDGSRLAFVASSEGEADLGQLWIRDLDSLTARPLPGTEGASFPFWSPDSKFIGFFATRKLKRIDVQGAPPITLADAPSPLGGSWSRHDVIVYRPDSAGLRRVSARGGDSVAVSRADPSFDGGDDLPWFLPDGRHFLYTSQDKNGTKATVYVADIDAPDPAQSRRQVMSALSNVVYSSGYLLFVSERTLMAQRFSLDKLATAGDPIPVAEQINYRAGGSDAAFSASQNGTLIYSAGDAATEVHLTWFDRSGKPVGTLGTPASQTRPAISPDESKVMIDRRDRPRTGLFELWLYDLKQNNSSRFTFNSDTFLNNFPVWSPDGNYVAFSSTRDGLLAVYRRPLNGGADELLDRGLHPRQPTDWSPDGNFIIEQVFEPKNGGDIWVLPLSGERKPYPYIQSEADEARGRLSPNGLWLAYSSNESKTTEIYVQSFPKPGNKRKISTDGGSRPGWSRDGKELYFWARNNRTLMAVSVNSGPSFEAGTPHPLFDARQAGTGSWFDVTKDGRFLIPLQPEPKATRSMTVVFNWPADLKE